MKQEDFVSQHSAEWGLFERWLNTRSDIRAKKRKPLASNDISDYDFPVRYRRLCQHLSIAQQRGYSPLITDKLEMLMQRGHNVLYRPPAPRWRLSGTRAFHYGSQTDQRAGVHVRPGQQVRHAWPQ